MSMATQQDGLVGSPVNWSDDSPGIKQILAERDRYKAALEEIRNLHMPDFGTAQWAVVIPRNIAHKALKGDA